MDALENITVLEREIAFLGSGQFVANMATALVCGLLIAFFYRLTYRRRGRSAVFVNSLVALSMITTIVITVIGNNLARAFGLVGALSIIRFRMAVKDVKDIVFIFFALAVGMATGVDLLLTALTGTVFIGIVVFVLSRAHGARPKQREFRLLFSFTPPTGLGEKAPYQPVLKKYCKRCDLVKAKPSKVGDVLALSYSVDLKIAAGEDLVRELGQIAGVSRAVLTKSGSKRRKKSKVK